MKNKGDIVFINDDIDDKFIYESMFNELGIENPIAFFDNSKDAFDYFINPKSNPFLILCDINLPVINGLELKQQILDNPVAKSKCFPFIFFTTGISEYELQRALCLSIQGYFIKEIDYDKQKQSFKKMINYWQESYFPQI